MVAVLLLHMPEEHAFWTFSALMKGSSLPSLEGMFTEGMPTLQLFMHQWEALLQAEMPKLAFHLDGQGVLPPLYAPSWFNTLFSYSLPFDYLVRIWDIFMLEVSHANILLFHLMFISSSTQTCLCLLTGNENHF
jgi:hypothetical protein